MTRKQDQNARTRVGTRFDRVPTVIRAFSSFRANGFRTRWNQCIYARLRSSGKGSSIMIRQGMSDRIRQGKGIIYLCMMQNNSLMIHIT
jgi:hypothetical protein